MGRQPRRARGPEDGVSYCSNAVADDLAGGVDSACETLSAAGEGPEICHHATLPEEGVSGRPDRADANYLAWVVDSVRDAVEPTGERTEVGHCPVLPEERMRRG